MGVFCGKEDTVFGQPNVADSKIRNWLELLRQADPETRRDELMVRNLRPVSRIRRPSNSNDSCKRHDNLIRLGLDDSGPYLAQIALSEDRFVFHHPQSFCQYSHMIDGASQGSRISMNAQRLQVPASLTAGIQKVWAVAILAAQVVLDPGVTVM
jgi:hypothetical protein